MGLWCDHVHIVSSVVCDALGHCFPSYRLAGFPPFWHRKQLIMLRKIMNGDYEFVSPEWDDISDAAKDMVRTNLL